MSGETDRSFFLLGNHRHGKPIGRKQSFPYVDATTKRDIFMLIECLVYQ